MEEQGGESRVREALPLIGGPEGSSITGVSRGRGRLIATCPKGQVVFFASGALLS